VLISQTQLNNSLGLVLGTSGGGRSHTSIDRVSAVIIAVIGSSTKNSYGIAHSTASSLRCIAHDTTHSLGGIAHSTTHSFGGISNSTTDCLSSISKSISNFLEESLLCVIPVVIFLFLEELLLVGYKASSFVLCFMFMFVVQT
jgi:hypothetical protein